MVDSCRIDKRQEFVAENVVRLPAYNAFSFGCGRLRGGVHRAGQKKLDRQTGEVGLCSEDLQRARQEDHFVVPASLEHFLRIPSEAPISVANEIKTMSHAPVSEHLRGFVTSLGRTV